MQVVVLDRNSLPDGVEFPPLDLAHFRWVEYGSVPPEEIPDRAWRADVIVTFQTPLDPETLSRLPRLRLIVSTSGISGLVDVKTAEAQGVTWRTLEEDVRDPADQVEAIVAIIEEFARAAPMR
jgi:lactate dehydrogenase-like 2-hydroxyacid dehydrogenase